MGSIPGWELIFYMPHTVRLKVRKEQRNNEPRICLGNKGEKLGKQGACMPEGKTVNTFQGNIKGSKSDSIKKLTFSVSLKVIT